MDYLLLLELIGRLLLAAFLGFIIGLERELAGQPAGERTHALAALGAAAFGMLSIYAFPGADTARVAAQVVTGLGFLGAGLIMKRERPEGREIQGLTTAAGIWAVGAIGLAIGAGYYAIGVAAAVIVGIILISERLLQIDRRFARLRERWEADEASSLDEGKHG